MSHCPFTYYDGLKSKIAGGQFCVNLVQSNSTFLVESDKRKYICRPILMRPDRTYLIFVLHYFVWFTHAELYFSLNLCLLGLRELCHFPMVCCVVGLLLPLVIYTIGKLVIWVIHIPITQIVKDFHFKLIL